MAIIHPQSESLSSHSAPPLDDQIGDANPLQADGNNNDGADFNEATYNTVAPEAEATPGQGVDSYINQTRTVDRQNHRRRGPVVAGAALALAAIAGVSALGLTKSGEGAEPVAPGATTTEQTTPLVTGNSVKSLADITEAEFNPETDSTVGNISVARILPTDETFTITRQNGQVAEIAKLRDPTEDPNLYAESVLGVMSGLLSSQNEADTIKALNELTDDPDLKEWLLNYKSIGTDPHFHNYTEGADVFVSIFDTPDMPANFIATTSADNGNPTIELNSGEVRFLVFGSLRAESIWNGPASHHFTPDFGFVGKAITFEVDPASNKLEEISIK